MRLAEYTDYTLRVLMYCASNRERLVTIAEVADQHGVSKNHLMKIVNDLAREGVLETTRGRGGGMRLLLPPDQIRVGDIVRRSETDFRLVECFDDSTSNCGLDPACRLKRLLHDALQAYFKTLDGATLADITGPSAVARTAPVGRPRRRPTVTRVALPVSRQR
jgi:Rrf2 family transcriptional regulator, nitric oxide-sensitive transcriptional repressor